MRLNLADAHLTYIASNYRFGDKTYDVYGSQRGPQLGWVYRRDHRWFAASDDPAVRNVAGRTRWEAATAMWPA